MTHKSEAILALEGFNVGICALAGAGKGADTPPEAVARYKTLLVQHRHELRELVLAAESAPDAREHRHYIEGMHHVMSRAFETANAQ